MWRKDVVAVSILVVLAICSGSSSDGSAPTATTNNDTPVTSVAAPSVVDALDIAASTTTIADRRLVWSMTFDTAAIFGRLIRSSGDPTELLARYDTVQQRVTASVEVAPIVDMRRSGRWLWVLQMTQTANARSPGLYPLGNAAELSWLDPR